MPVTDYYEYQDLFEECGCCGHFHRPEFRGDCRNDLERFSASDLEEQFSRRAELDQELKAMGAHIIRVRDLGAALEAREWGERAVERMTDPDPSPFLMTGPKYLGRGAAHLARVALGEVGG